MKLSKASSNLLDMVPKIKEGIKWEECDGKVVVKVPRFKSALGKDVCVLLGVKQSFNLRLDELGTFAWKCIDGKRKVSDIADELEKEFGEKAEPLIPRLAKFIEILENSGLIVMSRKFPQGGAQRSRRPHRRA